MRTLVIGDLHGCLTALTTLLDVVQPTAEDRVITLGDYTDRGPDSRGVLDRLCELFDAGVLIPVRGNHDELLILARQGQESRLWLSCGGRETLASYGIPFESSVNLDRVPERHWRFLEHDCRNWHETETHLFVHATVLPDLPMSDQPSESLLWDKLYEPVVHRSGKTLVVGHTRQPEGIPRRIGKTIWIDTGAYTHEGWLTCLDVGRGFYWQANQRGEARTGHLDEQ